MIPSSRSSLLVLVLFLTVFVVYVHSFHNSLSPRVQPRSGIFGRGSLRIQMLIDKVDMDIMRDDSWRTDSNPIDYSNESSSNRKFSNLNQLGINVSDVSKRMVIPIHNVCGDDLFCNREINMNEVDAVGFDMDFTLAGYNREFDLLAYNGAKEKLVNWLGYPEEVLYLEYSQDYCVRGCLIDKKRGNILKTDRHKYVTVASHGLTKLSSELRKSLYRDNYNEMNSFSGSNFVSIDTPFSLVDGCLFAQLVDLFDKGLALGGNGDYSKSYEQIWSDMRKCVDRCHKDGAIKLTVAEDPEKYIIYDPNTFPMLEQFKKSGKKVFLVTNSLWDYTQVVMNYLQGRKTGDTKNLEWMDYFDVIITGACKPAFLKDESSLPLFRVNPELYSLKHIDIRPSGENEVNKFLEHGKLFQGGNAKWLHTLLSLRSGDRLMYVGDHVYADVLRSKRTLGWRTVLVVPELTDEIISHKKCKNIREEILKLRRRQFSLQNDIDSLDDEWSIIDENEGIVDDTTKKAEKQRLAEILLEISSQLSAKIKERDAIYHRNWGPLFKARMQDSRFAKQITDYACLYTSRASNLGAVSPVKPYRNTRDMLPHDMDRPLYQN